MKRMQAMLGGLAAAAAMALAALPARAQDLFELIGKNPELSTFASFVKAAGLEEAMKAKGPLTVMAPSNAAFARFEPHVLERLATVAEKPRLQDIIKIHVLPGDYPTSRLTNAYQDTFRVTTPEGTSLLVDVTRLKRKQGPLAVEGIPLSRGEAKASNGTLYIIDAVLLPPRHRDLAPKPGAAPRPPPGPAATRAPTDAEKAAKPAGVERSETPAEPK